MAAPVLDHEAKVVAAVNVALPAEKFGGDLRADAITRVLDLGRELSISMGYQSEYPLFNNSPP